MPSYWIERTQLQYEGKSKFINWATFADTMERLTYGDTRYPHRMSTRTNLVPANVYAYVLRQTREPEVLAELRAATSRVPHNVMQIGADQGALMALLVRLIGSI